MNLFEKMALMIPAPIREIIIEGGLIDAAFNSDVTGTPMEYLFDVYEEFLDPTGEHDDWTCYKCRDHILKDWKKMKPFLTSSK